LGVLFSNVFRGGVLEMHERMEARGKAGKNGPRGTIKKLSWRMRIRRLKEKGEETWVGPNGFTSLGPASSRRTKRSKKTGRNADKGGGVSHCEEFD